MNLTKSIIGLVGILGGVMAHSRCTRRSPTSSEEIDTGALAPGEQLPTELGLSEGYGASRNTIRDAIKRLTSLGLVETRQGQGTFVTRRIDPFVTVLTDP